MWLLWMPESSCFRRLFCSQSVDGSQALRKSIWQELDPNFPLIQQKVSQKISLSLRCEILGLFSKTLASNHMYFRDNWGKFPQGVITPLSQKGKTFFQIFVVFLESTESFINFDKKFQLYSLNSWEVIDSEKCGCLNAQKLPFQNTLPQSKCSGETNTAEICLAERLF